MVDNQRKFWVELHVQELDFPASVFHKQIASFNRWLHNKNLNNRIVWSKEQMI